MPRAKVLVVQELIAGHRARRIFFLNHDEAIGARDHERMQDDAIDQAVDGDVGADADGECRDRREDKRRRLPKQPERVA